MTVLSNPIHHVLLPWHHHEQFSDNFSAASSSPKSAEMTAPVSARNQCICFFDRTVTVYNHVPSCFHECRVISANPSCTSSNHHLHGLSFFSGLNACTNKQTLFDLMPSESWGRNDRAQTYHGWQAPSAS